MTMGEQQARWAAICKKHREECERATGCKIILPDELWQGHDLRAVIAASNFHVTNVMVLDGAGEPLRSDWAVVEAFTAIRRRNQDPPRESPDDWPLIELSAPAELRTKKGKKPGGREIARPARLLDPNEFVRLAHVRAGVVLEIQAAAIETMKREFRLRPLPPRAPWTRNRAGDWQGWFMWPGGMCRDGASALPDGVQLLDHVVGAPLDAKDVPQRLDAFKLPTLPKWLALAAGGRDAKTTAECLLNQTSNLNYLQLDAQGHVIPPHPDGFVLPPHLIPKDF